MAVVEVMVVVAATWVGVRGRTGMPMAEGKYIPAASEELAEQSSARARYLARRAATVSHRSMW